MDIKSHQILEDATPGLSRNSSITTDQPITPLVSYYVYTIVMYILGFSLTSALAMFGVFSNTVNIIMFYKMGFQETTNINFFSLAINDLMASCGNLLVEIFQSPFMKIDELPQGSLILQTTYLASFVVYSCCGFGALITAVLAMERCLCIVFPLKHIKDTFGALRSLGPSLSTWARPGNMMAESDVNLDLGDSMEVS
ncbi:hypothetical protein RRG08_030529 [Elysia crispata]|uniref:G-protein coupled receptors family 1 profile domain-containing protein n=1 Tax=Elysia crispata TaxID=231223 RepID=A0AAE0YNN8_9GAST|nr:hypothetical protein RRG08_030529 [Elysia crispata]